MKNLLKISLIAVLLFISSGVYALDETFSLKVKSNAQKSVMFFIREAQDVQVSIYGSDDELLYTQKIHASAPAAKTYNLEAFPDGTYLIKLENDLAVTAYEIKIEEGKTVVNKPLITEKFKPVLVKDKSMVTLNMENFEKGPIEVKIVNEYNDQLYSNTFNDKAKLSKKFNIGNTDAKELTFIVRFKNQEFIKTVSVN